MSYKKFVKYVAGVLSLFLLFHMTIWVFFTSDLLEEPSKGGDLARMAYALGSKYPREKEITLDKTHLDYAQYHGQAVDIVTVGDSFSFGLGGGKNPYYQDYIASLYDLDVLNITPFCQQPTDIQCNPINTIVTLLNSGALTQEIKPKMIVIESSEKYAVSRFSQDVDWNQSLLHNDTVKRNNSAQEETESSGLLKFINTGNYKFLLYNFYYLNSPNAKGKSGVYKADLNTSFFSCNDDHTLLFYFEDLNKIHMNMQSNIKRMNDNLNSLAKLLKKQNIGLTLLIAVDKFDLYSPYIIDNPYPDNPFFDIFDQEYKEYYSINSKQILAKELAQGKKDIFFSDDTHWSNFASEAIIRQTPFDKMVNREVKDALQ